MRITDQLVRWESRQAQAERKNLYDSPGKLNLMGRKERQRPCPVDTGS